MCIKGILGERLGEAYQYRKMMRGVGEVGEVLARWGRGGEVLARWERFWRESGRGGKGSGENLGEMEGFWAKWERFWRGSGRIWARYKHGREELQVEESAETISGEIKRVRGFDLNELPAAFEDVSLSEWHGWHITTDYGFMLQEKCMKYIFLV